MRELGGQIIHKSPTLNVKTKGLSSVCGERCLETADMSMPKRHLKFESQVLPAILAPITSTVASAIPAITEGITTGVGAAAKTASSILPTIAKTAGSIGSNATQMMGKIGSSGFGKTASKLAEETGKIGSDVVKTGTNITKEYGPDIIKHGPDVTEGFRKNIETLKGQMDDASGSKYTRSPSVTAHADDAQEFQKESTEHPEFPPKIIKQIVKDHKKKDILEEFLRR